MRVLLIEDDSATAKSIELMLKAEGCSLSATDLGEEGIDLGKIYDYDLILLDLSLPDMSGLNVLRHLRAARINTPITANSSIAPCTIASLCGVHPLGFVASEVCSVITSTRRIDAISPTIKNGSGVRPPVRIDARTVCNTSTSSSTNSSRSITGRIDSSPAHSANARHNW